MTKQSKRKFPAVIGVLRKCRRSDLAMAGLTGLTLAFATTPCVAQPTAATLQISAAGGTDQCNEGRCQAISAGNIPNEMRLSWLSCAGRISNPTLAPVTIAEILVDVLNGGLHLSPTGTVTASGTTSFVLNASSAMTLAANWPLHVTLVLSQQPFSAGFSCTALLTSK